MSNDILTDLELRIDEAVEHLRDQQSLLAVMDYEMHQDIFLSLISSVLVQFYRLTAQRRALLQQ